MEVIERSKPKAKKDHKCDFCGGVISKGETYDYSKNKMDNILYSWKSHIECSAIVGKLNMYEFCDEGVTTEDFQEAIKQEYQDIMWSKYPDEYESSSFEYPSFLNQLAFVKKEHGMIKELEL